MKKAGKKFRKVVEELSVDREAKLEEAIELLKKHAYTKFDSTLEGKIKIRYKSLQDVRGFIKLPHGTGKDVRVLVITREDYQEQAKQAGADIVGGQDIIEKIRSENWLDFDACIASPDIMRSMTKIAPILGRRGLMPKPKAGTVTIDFAPIIQSLKKGQYEYKADKSGVVHLRLGKLSFSQKALEENCSAAFDIIKRDKPSEAKGNYVSSLYLKSTMSPSIRVIAYSFI